MFYLALIVLKLLALALSLLPRPVFLAAGRGLGSNTRAALISRGVAEIKRLTVALGGNPETVSGLAGIGDLATNLRIGRKTERYVLADRHPLEQGVFLKDDSAVRSRHRYRLAGAGDGAGGWLFETGNHVEQGALAAARRPKQAYEFAGGNRQIDFGDGLQILSFLGMKGLGHGGNIDELIGHS